MERKIGETFEYEGKKLQVKGSVCSSCNGCFFEGRCSSSRKEVTGHCQFEYRTDNNEVIFVEVQEHLQELNLCEILKDCPVGTILWCLVMGKVTLIEVSKSNDFPIVVKSEDKRYHYFTKKGALCKSEDASCILFPSKGCRDWSKWKCPKPKFDPKTFKPFDRILVRNSCIDNWGCSFFSNHRKDELFPFLTCDASAIKYCVPYNEETKHLVGTSDEAPEFYKYWED